MADESKTVKAVVDRRLSTAELQTRYGLESRTTVLNRIKALGVETYKESNSVFVSEASLLTLDALDECLKRPQARLAECVAAIKQEMDNGTSVRSELTGHSKNMLSNTPKTSDALTVEIIAWALEAIAIRLGPAPDPDPAANLRILYEAADGKWVIPTSMVRKLLGLRSLPRLQDGMFQRRGLTFARVEPRMGLEREWTVQRRE